MSIHDIVIHDHAIRLEVPPTVMPPSPYSHLLAEAIPDLSGLTVADVGTGCGIQAIVAKLQGAAQVYLLDSNPTALTTSMDNLRLNGVADGCITMPAGDVLGPLPIGLQVDVILCNPASLPMPVPDQKNSPYFAGVDGRQMIERLICQAQSHLKVGGWLYLVHTSLADYQTSEQ